MNSSSAFFGIIVLVLANCMLASGSLWPSENTFHKAVYSSKIDQKQAAGIASKATLTPTLRGMPTNTRTARPSQTRTRSRSRTQTNRPTYTRKQTPSRTPSRTPSVSNCAPDSGLMFVGGNTFDSCGATAGRQAVCGSLVADKVMTFKFVAPNTAVYVFTSYLPPVTDPANLFNPYQDYLSSTSIKVSSDNCAALGCTGTEDVVKVALQKNQAALVTVGLLDSSCGTYMVSISEYLPAPRFPPKKTLPFPLDSTASCTSPVSRPLTRPFPCAAVSMPCSVKCLDTSQHQQMALMYSRQMVIAHSRQI
mmetsp:Transcript_3977/g.6116  ORF Transcript_3977/g.6116 Transcript_3977/m.6116 type:complete len:307 (-) Transcript_3977:1221-2141(-)